MELDYTKRISAEQALKHEYFDEIREFKLKTNTTAIDFPDIILDDEENE